MALIKKRTCLILSRRNKHRLSYSLMDRVVLRLILSVSSCLFFFFFFIFFFCALRQHKHKSKYSSASFISSSSVVFSSSQLWEFILQSVVSSPPPSLPTDRLSPPSPPSARPRPRGSEAPSIRVDVFIVQLSEDVRFGKTASIHMLMNLDRV